MTETPGPEMFAAAASYALRGWPVFPCGERSKVPCKEEGFFEHGVSEAKKSGFWIKQFWNRWPRANVGMAAGEEAGWWVLDADIAEAKDGKPAENGFETIEILEGLFGEALPETLSQLTPSGGRHWLFKWPGRPVKNSTRSRVGPGLDTRSNGGYIVGPPSIHPDFDARYQWISPPETTPIQAAPEWLTRLAVGEPDDLEWCRQQLDGKDLPAWLAKRVGRPTPPVLRQNAAKTERVSAYARAALEDECKRVRQTGPGNQNNALNEGSFKLGGLVGSGALPEDVAFQHLMAAALAWTIDSRKGGWKPDHLEKIIRTGIEAGRKHPREVPQAAEREQQQRQRYAPRRGRRRVQASSGAALGIRLQAGRAVWDARQPLDGTPAAAFLQAQGINPAAVGPWFGFVPELEYLHMVEGAEPINAGRYPALIAGMAEWPKPEIRAVLALCLTPEGNPAKVYDPGTGEVLPTRTLIGAWSGAAVRLGKVPADVERLHVATGPVTGLQARAAVPDVPVWVGGPLSACMHLLLPISVREVVVIGAAGSSEQARMRAALALGGPDQRVSVRFAGV